MTTRDDVKIAEILANSETILRQRLIELVTAGARSSVLYNFVGAIGGIENAANTCKDFEEDDD